MVDIITEDTAEAINELRDRAYRAGKLKMLDELTVMLAKKGPLSVLSVSFLVEMKDDLEKGWKKKGLEAG